VTTESISLNGKWEVVFDPADSGKTRKYFKSFPAGKPIQVPGVWEQVKPGYDGVGWYHRSFTVRPEWKGKVLRLRFNAVNYFAEVWLNGIYVGSHEGGYTPFVLDISRAARAGDNDLVVRVVDPPRDREVEGFRSSAPLLRSALATWKAGWYYTFGGIWQGVELLVTEKIFINDIFVIGSALQKKVTATASLINRGKPVRAVVTAKACSAKNPDEVPFIHRQTVHLNKGKTTCVISRSVRNFTPWDCDHPFLYRMEVQVETAGAVVNQAAVRFGIRDFHTQGQHFYLNDKRVYLKGFLQQGVYPRTLVFPHGKAMALREMELLKKNGFNFIRAHLKPTPPELLDLADEMGILVSGEPPLGWILGTPAAARRCRNEVRELVLRDRNRPCVILWCLFNEIRNEVTTQLKRTALMRLARDLDPTRIVIGNSGSFSSKGGLTDCIYPYSMKRLNIIDNHAYYGTTQAGLRQFRTAGRRGIPAYVSEFSALEDPMDYEKVLAGYTPQERRLGLEEYAQYKRYYDSLKQVYRQAGLGRMFKDVRQYLASINRMNEERARLTVSNMRVNPLCDGYAYCQLADASGELFGATDLWRRPKPLFHGLAQASQTPYLNTLIEPRVLRQGDDCLVDITLINEDKLGECYQTVVTLKDASGRGLATFRRETTARNWTDSILKKKVKIAWGPGRYQLDGKLLSKGNVVAHNTMNFTILPEPHKTVDRVVLFDMAENLHKPFRSLGYKLVRGHNNYKWKDLVNVFSLSPSTHVLLVKEYLGAVRRIAQVGGVVIFLEPIMGLLYDHLLPVAVRRMRPMRNSIYIHDHPIFDGLPKGVMDYEYEEIQPDVFNEPADLQKLRAKIVSGTISSHMWTRPDIYEWGSCLDIIPLGRGHVITCHYKLLENVTKHRIARNLLVNLVNYAATLIKPGGDERLWSGRCIDLLK
jgi:hypothetical protein